MHLCLPHAESDISRKPRNGKPQCGSFWQRAWRWSQGHARSRPKRRRIRPVPEAHDAFLPVPSESTQQPTPFLLLGDFGSIRSAQYGRVGTEATFPISVATTRPAFSLVSALRRKCPPCSAACYGHLLVSREHNLAHGRSMMLARQGRQGIEFKMLISALDDAVQPRPRARRRPRHSTPTSTTTATTTWLVTQRSVDELRGNSPWQGWLQVASALAAAADEYECAHDVVVHHY